MSKWHSGPPPHVGWWNASSSHSGNLWRWWNGRYWSFHCMPRDSLQEICRRSRLKAGHQSIIQWTDYWPENARVPRIDLRKA